MGGNALLYAKTGRATADGYRMIMSEVMTKLSDLFKATRMSVVQSVHGKESFGDGDILLENKNLPVDWIAQVVDIFRPNEVMINRTKDGKSHAPPLRFIDPNMALEPENTFVHDTTHYPVPREHIPCSAISFDYQGFQIDLIVTEPENFGIAQVYYAYNDLGNLMGRIADRMGFKYGWNGLWKQLGEGNNIYDTVLVTRGPEQIFSLLGYDYGRFKMGFETLENMFEFAASTPYFHRGPYQFENRNHKDRIRDEKRASYRAFVAWLENKPWLDKYTWTTYERNTLTEARKREKAAWMTVARNRFFDFSQRVSMSERTRQLATEAKKVWNGEVVRQVTGLSGKLLGAFMDRCRTAQSARLVDGNFDLWISEKSPQEVEAFIREMLCG